LKIEQVASKTRTKMNKKIKTIIIFFIFIIIAIGTVYFITSKASNKSTTLILRTAVAQTEDLSTTITGSAPLFSSNKVSIAGRTNGTIIKINFKEGDKVKAGDVLFNLDETDTIANVENVQSNLDEMMLSQNSNMSNLKKLNVTAPINGQITNISVSVGETVPKNGTLFTIINTKKMKLTVPFNGNDITRIKVGFEATINLQNQMQSITGIVTFIGNEPYTAPDGGEMYNVEISINNPGALTEGTKASAVINITNETLSSIDVGNLTYTDKIIVKSDTGGTIQEINEKLYQGVKAGNVIMKLTNSDITDSITTTKVKLHGLEKQLKITKKQLTDCNITSPINGIVTEITVGVGETIKQGDTLTSITDPSHMVFKIPVDELDIAKVKVNQKVDITVDALETTLSIPLKGKVKAIAVEGTPSNGVTTYDVTVAVTGVTTTVKATGAKASKKGNKKGGKKGGTNPGQSNGNGGGKINRILLTSLKDGMNANGTIYLTQKKGVLTVPIEAIFKIDKKNYVMVKSDVKTIEELKKNRKYIDVFKTTSSSGNVSNKNAAYYSTAIPTEVKIGINTDSSVEITSGIKANDVVILPPLIGVSKGSSKISDNNLSSVLGGNALKVPKGPKAPKARKAGGGK
jgi:HlyD family secretion protein